MDEIRAFLAVQDVLQAQVECAVVVRRSRHGLQFELEIWLDPHEDELDVLVSRREGEPRWRATWHDGDAEIRCAIEDLPAFGQDLLRYGIDAAVAAWALARDESADTGGLVEC